jgi:uncharacterized protein (TIGR03083 family)
VIHTREEVADRTRREFEHLDALVNRLTADDWDRPVPRPETRAPWTVKDALAHIVYWKEHTTRVIRGQRRPAEARGLDVNALNELIYRAWRERSPDEVVAWHRAVQADAMRALAEAPPERFSGRARSAGWPLDFDGHSAHHRIRDIERAIAPD